MTGHFPAGSGNPHAAVLLEVGAHGSGGDMHTVMSETVQRGGGQPAGGGGARQLGKAGIGARRKDWESALEKLPDRLGPLTPEMPGVWSMRPQANENTNLWVLRRGPPRGIFNLWPAGIAIGGLAVSIRTQTERVNSTGWWGRISPAGGLHSGGDGIPSRWAFFRPGGALLPSKTIGLRGLRPVLVRPTLRWDAQLTHSWVIYRLLGIATRSPLP